MSITAQFKLIFTRPCFFIIRPFTFSFAHTAGFRSESNDIVKYMSIYLPPLPLCTYRVLWHIFDNADCNFSPYPCTTQDKCVEFLNINKATVLLHHPYESHFLETLIQERGIESLNMVLHVILGWNVIYTLSWTCLLQHGRDTDPGHGIPLYKPVEACCRLIEIPNFLDTHHCFEGNMDLCECLPEGLIRLRNIYKTYCFHLVPNNEMLKSF